MKREQIKIREAGLQDAQAILQIYAPYITDTGITFEYEVPTLEVFSERMQAIIGLYPYLVAEIDGEVVGYCYASQFKGRAAYDWSVETTIYIKMGCTGLGIGTMLYEKLEEFLARQNILNLNACIAFPNPESISYHERMNYKLVAHFHKCGYKQGVWYDMVWMEKMLGQHPLQPLPVVPVRLLSTPCRVPRCTASEPIK